MIFTSGSSLYTMQQRISRRGCRELRNVNNNKKNNNNNRSPQLRVRQRLQHQQVRGGTQNASPLLQLATPLHIDEPLPLPSLPRKRRSRQLHQPTLRHWERRGGAPYAGDQLAPPPLHPLVGVATTPLAVSQEHRKCHHLTRLHRKPRPLVTHPSLALKEAHWL